MARIRTIKPQHWADKKLAELSLPAHLLWIGMWNFSDDAGVIEADPLFIRSQIFPRRTDVRVEQVSQWLDQLVKARFLIPFEYNNESYYVSRTFSAHQKIDKPQPSKIPSDTIRRLFDERSTNDRPCRVKESKGKGREVDAPSEKSKLPSLETENPAPQTGAAPLRSSGPPFEEVHRFFRGAGGSEEMARKFWNKWEASDWMDGQRKITKWSALAYNFITNYEENKRKYGEGTSSGSKSNHGQSTGAIKLAQSLASDLGLPGTGGTDNS